MGHFNSKVDKIKWVIGVYYVLHYYYEMWGELKLEMPNTKIINDQLARSMWIYYLLFKKLAEMGENIIKGTKGAKVKSPFPRVAHDVYHFYVGL